MSAHMSVNQCMIQIKVKYVVLVNKKNEFP